MRIVHIITGLKLGGTENTLYKICKHDSNNEHIVISLRHTGKYFSLLKKMKIKTYFLNISFYPLQKFFFLIRLLRSLKPDVVQTWLVHSDLIGGIASRLAGIKNVVWNIRYSALKTKNTKLNTIIILNILSKLSYLVPQLIVVNSKKGKKVYENKGYEKKKIRYIPNGYDLSILKPDKIKKKKFKIENRIFKKIPLIGNLARYDQLKDHSNLLNALSIIRSKQIDFFCVLAGPNIYKNIKLNKQLKKLKLEKHVKLIGVQTDITKILNGIDFFVLSSISEGFPNVVAESMACGAPCVATDVGDIRLIVNNNGWVVPPGNSIELAKMIEKALYEFKTSNWKNKSIEARLIIKKKFSIENMIKSYNKLWNNIKKIKK